ncbi:MAG: hypothetical protein BWK77_00820 [Verrucomicrobia bacterium A1]|nr:MAG: hypothetical protein BWK77_00820 [Verrucomicrobia bacterium A1]
MWHDAGMSSVPFHHPDLSVTVLRRRASEFLLDLLAYYGEAAVTRGRSLLWSDCFSSRRAYEGAVWRLRKKGSVSISRGKDGRRLLRVAPGHEESAALRPDRYWKRRWDGWWRVLVYDIPEDERSFRNGLRKFLARLRMGYLQHSVWISPWDIRPDYADLQTSLNLESVSFLFEARTVLGRTSSDLVLEAWGFEQLADAQRDYLAASGAYLRDLRDIGLTREQLSAVARQEMMHYLHAMAADPLLPKILIPAGYQGFRVFEQHCRVSERVQHWLKVLE